MFYVSTFGSDCFGVSSYPRGIMVMYDTREKADAACKQMNRSSTLDRLKNACLDYALAHELPGEQVDAALNTCGGIGLLDLIPRSQGAAGND